MHVPTVIQAQIVFDLPEPLPEVASTVPVFAAAGPVVTGIADLKRYATIIEIARAQYDAAQSPGAALYFSRAIINAALDCAAPDATVMISNSWGKDSSAMLGIYCEVLLERKQNGQSTPATMVITADTGSEFIDMQVRTEEENTRLTAWAKKHNLQIETHVVRPAAKDGLLANLIGGGRPLPRYSNAKKAGPITWCVDRLKTGPIQKSIALAKGKSGKILHFLGVRSDESTKRAGSIAEHSDGLPFGLARVSMARRKNGVEVKVEDTDRLGVQPIVHFSHEDLTVYMRLNMAPWNAFSFESLKEIYKKGASKDDANGAGECRITLTKDGGVSNTCSDLSGSRFGCLLCLQSKNKSLSNYAEKDKRYHWIRVAHRYLYNGIRQHQLRMKDFQSAGWDRATLFPKTYLFSWRVKLLALIYRAEITSGFTLIDAATEEAIVQWWHRSGIFTVKPSDIKADVVRWIATGKLAFSYEAAAANYESLSLSLSEGIPGGVYAHALYPESFVQPLHLANLMAMAGRGNGFYPQVKAYVFRDLSSRGGFLTMLTDTPSDMGRRTNTDALNGFSGFAMELVGVRDVTPYERSLLRGRTCFYRQSKGGLQARLTKMTGTEWAPGLVPANETVAGLHDILLADLNLFDPCGEHALADSIYDGHFIATLKGNITPSTLKNLMERVCELVYLSDYLSERHDTSRRTTLVRHKELLDRLGSDAMDNGDDTARQVIKQAISEGWDAKDTVKFYLAYVEQVRALADIIRAGQANTELINRLAYIARTAIYDAGDAAEMTADLVKRLIPAQRAA